MDAVHRSFTLRGPGVPELTSPPRESDVFGADNAMPPTVAGGPPQTRLTFLAR